MSISKKISSDHTAKFISEELARYYEKIAKNIDQDYEISIATELHELRIFTKFTESVTKRLKNLYKESFPKTCSTCGKSYNTRQEFLEATFELKKNMVILDQFGLQEYRNCICGSTLFIWTKEQRRDNSEFGHARRQLFELCLAKLMLISSASDEDLKEKLRNAFADVIKSCEENPEILNEI